MIRAVAREAARQQRLVAAEQRRQIREQDRTVREAHRTAIRSQKDNLRLAKEDAREAKQRYLLSREEEAEELNTENSNILNDLDCILQNTLAIDDKINFGSLRVNADEPLLRTPWELSQPAAEPSKTTFLAGIIAPTGISKLFPGSKRRHERRLAEAEQAFNAAYAVWSRGEIVRQTKLKEIEESRARALKEFEEKKALRNAEVDAFEASYREGESGSVISYCCMVLEKSSYPDGFPQNFSVAYRPESKQLVIEYEIPTPAIIPDTGDFRYVKAKDEIVGKPRKASDIKMLYADVIAAIALRTIHEIFEADQGSNVDVCCFNGYVSTVDPATGHDIQPHLISVRTTKQTFMAIDLARVDKGVCLRNLGAQVSRSASEAQPVKPIVEFDMADARFVDQNDLIANLDSATNLMDLNPTEFEHLVANLFGQMGLESKLTRSSRDGGVDCIAYDPRPVLGGKVVIQAKRYRHTVGVSAVRDLFGTMMNEGANKGILVATSGYGPDAFDFAKDKPIELIDGGGLLFLLQEAGISARIVMPTD